MADYSLQIRERCQDLVFSDATIKKIMSIFLDEVNAGLSKKLHDKAIVKCFVTYVQDLPNGTGTLILRVNKFDCNYFVWVCVIEEGKFLALDLGGTNFRVLLIELSKDHFEMRSKIYAIPQHIMLGSGEQVCVVFFFHF